MWDTELLQIRGLCGQVKISTQHPEVLALACEHFLEKNEHEVEVLLKETLEGHQRGIMGTMSVEVCISHSLSLR